MTSLKEKFASGTPLNEFTVDADIWEITEEPPQPERAGQSESSPAPPGASSTIPPRGSETFVGTGPVHPSAVQASSVVPRSDLAATVQGSYQANVLTTEPAPAQARPPGPRGVFAPGEQFGVYRVGPCIGEGGMARIYQAEHAGLRRQVALKVLLDASTRAPEGRERFLREARIAAAIKHPNVVNIFDVGVHEDTAYLVMELLTGTDLEQLIQTRGALDEGTIVDIMVPVLAGLTAVHDAGVVHRDLKPGNVFLAQGRYDEVDPKLLDFGISKAAGPEQLRLTANGMLIGTPFYMSPEGLRGEEMTPSSDQYSLGVVMYECATGTNPFGASTFAEIFRLIGAGQYPPPSSTRPQISKRLERIIMRAMSLNPTDRFKDLREMGRELLLLAGQRTRITWSLSFGELERPRLSGTDTWKVPERSPSSGPIPDPEQRKRNWKRGLWLAAPLLLLGGVALAWSGAFSNQARPDAATAKSQQVGAQPSALPNVMTTPRGSEPQGPASLVVSPAPAAAISLPAAAPVQSHTRSSVVTSNTRTVPRQLGRHQAVSDAPTEKSSEADPEWAIPPASSVQAKVNQVRAQTGVGANGAPIFD